MKERVEIQVNDKLKIVKDNMNFIIVKLEENEVVVNKDTKETIKSSKWVEKGFCSTKRFDQVLTGLLGYVEMDERETITSCLERYNEMVKRLECLADEITEKLNG